MSAWEWQGEDLLLNVYVQPRASKDQIVGLHGEAIKVRITAPPVDGKANAHLQRYLAKALKLRKGQIELIGGQSSRHKRFRLTRPECLPEALKSL